MALGKCLALSGPSSPRCKRRVRVDSEPGTSRAIPSLDFPIQRVSGGVRSCDWAGVEVTGSAGPLQPGLAKLGAQVTVGGSLSAVGGHSPMENWPLPLLSAATSSQVPPPFFQIGLLQRRGKLMALGTAGQSRDYNAVAGFSISELQLSEQKNFFFDNRTLSLNPVCVNWERPAGGDPRLTEAKENCFRNGSVTELGLHLDDDSGGYSPLSSPARPGGMSLGRFQLLGLSTHHPHLSCFLPLSPGASSGEANSFRYKFR